MINENVNQIVRSGDYTSIPYSDTKCLSLKILKKKIN